MFKWRWSQPHSAEFSGIYESGSRGWCRRHWVVGACETPLGSLTFLPESPVCIYSVALLGVSIRFTGSAPSAKLVGRCPLREAGAVGDHPWSFVETWTHSMWGSGSHRTLLAGLLLAIALCKGGDGSPPSGMDTAPGQGSQLRGLSKGWLSARTCLPGAGLSTQGPACPTACSGLPLGSGAGTAGSGWLPSSYPGTDLPATFSYQSPQSYVIHSPAGPPPFLFSPLWAGTACTSTRATHGVIGEEMSPGLP